MLRHDHIQVLTLVLPVTNIRDSMSLGNGRYHPAYASHAALEIRLKTRQLENGPASRISDGALSY